MAKHVFARGRHFLFACGAGLIFSAGLLVPQAMAQTTTSGCSSCGGGCSGASAPCTGTCAGGTQCAPSCGCNDTTGSCTCNRPNP